MLINHYLLQLDRGSESPHRGYKIFKIFKIFKTEFLKSGFNMCKRDGQGLLQTFTVHTRTVLLLPNKNKA